MRAMSQQERFAYMLNELGMNQSQFAQSIQVGHGAVSNWCTGKRQIKPSSARAIENVYPRFSSAWIVGTTTYMNEAELIAHELTNKYMELHPEVLGFIELLSSNGYTLTMPMDDAVEGVEVNEGIANSTARYLTVEGCVSMEGYEPCAFISRGNDRLSISISDLERITRFLSESAESLMLKFSHIVQDS